MAINGTLSDIGFVSLLQFPNSSRKTGLLTVITIDGKAEFYYRNGELVHAKYGEKTGKTVLVDIVDWNEGQFSFESGLEPDETTISEDLHQILMWALKERDEKKRDIREVDTSTVEIDEALSRRLDELLKSTLNIAFICIFSPSGRIMARASSDEGVKQNIEPYIKSIINFIADYPCEITGKSFIEASDISIAISGLDETQTVVIATGPEVKLGRLSMTLARIIRELGGV